MSKYFHEFKMKVVKHYTEKHIGYTEIAKIFNIPSKTTVEKWVRKYQ